MVYYHRINGQLAKINTELHKEIKDIEVKTMYSLTAAERITRESLAADTERLRRQIQASSADHVPEKQFRDQLIMEINTLRKLAIERDKQFHDNFIIEKRKKEQLREQITQLMNTEKLNKKVSPHI